MNRTIEDIQKDIELLGIKGGYDVEQLLTPQDCRRLSYEIDKLHSIIKEAIEYINEKADYPIGYYHCLKELRDILKGEGK